MIALLLDLCCVPQLVKSLLIQYKTGLDGSERSSETMRLHRCKPMGVMAR
jgi:hypothetical protein